MYMAKRSVTVIRISLARGNCKKINKNTYRFQEKALRGFIRMLVICVGPQLTSRPDYEVLRLVPRQDPRNEVGLRCMGT
jgi:hypothetical protein